MPPLLASPHPAHEDLAGYVDGVLDPAPHEAVSAHLKACTWCADEAQELKQAWGALLAPAIPTPTMPITVQRRFGLWGRVRAFAGRLLKR
jgi:anti-sigma factor ChrR (cupin superfamily)